MGYTNSMIFIPFREVNLSPDALQGSVPTLCICLHNTYFTDISSALRYSEASVKFFSLSISNSWLIEMHHIPPPPLPVWEVLSFLDNAKEKKIDFLMPFCSVAFCGHSHKLTEVCITEQALHTIFQCNDGSVPSPSHRSTSNH